MRTLANITFLLLADAIWFQTGDLGQYHFQYYCEYPANFIRIVHRFLEQE